MSDGRLARVARALRQPPAWLLWVVAVGVGFLWSMAVLGISMELANTTGMWWVVLPFGTAPLVVVLLLMGRLMRGEGEHAARPAPPPLQETSSGRGEAGLDADSSVDDRPGLVEELTEREIEVLRLVSTGRTNDEIARDLYVARGTVKAHVSNIMGKLGASNRTQAVARGRDLGLLWSASAHRARQSHERGTAGRE